MRPRCGIVDEGSSATCLELRSHPMRAPLTEEMHLRKLPRFQGSARILQVVAMASPEEAQSVLGRLSALTGFHGALPDGSEKYLAAGLGDVDFVWERHSEFYTCTFVRPGDRGTWFDPSLFRDALAWLAMLPGEVIRATLIACLDRDAATPCVDQLAENFAADDLVSCDVASGRARIWSDFRLHRDGFGRLLVADQGLDRNEQANIIQQLQELGNYRKMALLGLPIVQRLMSEVACLEQRLAELTRQIAARSAADGPLLESLSRLSAELANMIAETRYRMSASRAYAELSVERVRGLNSLPLAGYRSLVDFTERRLLPAMRSCDAFSRRLDDLSQRAAWTSSLLQTRVDTELAKQNRDLLAAMNRRTDLQFRVQQTVESLSVVAISYYMMGLVDYVLEAARTVDPRFDIRIGGAVALPVVALIVWFCLHRIRKRINP